MKYLDETGLAYVKQKLDANYQDKLTSGTNIKTINNESILGSGNITISGGGASTDVQVNGTSIVSNNVANLVTNTAYNSSTNKLATMSDVPDISSKQDTLISGTNIKTINGTSLLGSGNISISGGSGTPEVVWLECNLAIGETGVPEFSSWVSTDVESTIDDANANNKIVMIKANILYNYEGTLANVGTWFFVQGQGGNMSYSFHAIPDTGMIVALTFEDSSDVVYDLGVMPFVSIQDLAYQPVITSATSSDIVDKFNTLIEWLTRIGLTGTEDDE